MTGGPDDGCRGPCGPDEPDDLLLERWHRARLAHAAATGADYGQALFEKIAAETAAIQRFGLGRHAALYRERYPARRP